ncbi:MAG: GNAT family N-acetyltransferase [Caldilineaceae bacterium]
MIEIAFLVDRLETIPTLTRWFRAQWPDYYAGLTSAEIAQDFQEDAKRDGLPVRLVALVDGQLAGTIVLREEATWNLPEYRPGLGGLFVTESYRGQGVGTALVRAGMELAMGQSHEMVYATTVNARGILERLGWTLVREVSHDDECYCSMVVN